MNVTHLIYLEQVLANHQLGTLKNLMVCQRLPSWVPFKLLRDIYLSIGHHCTSQRALSGAMHSETNFSARVRVKLTLKLQLTSYKPGNLK